MSTQVIVQTPTYTLSSGNLSFNLTASGNSSGSSEVLVDFSSLVPFASSASDATIDFFMLSACVYGIDRFIARRSNSVDGWSRELQVTFPVRDVQLWNTNRETLQKALSFLTGDYWEIEFTHNSLNLPIVPFDQLYQQTFAQVNLFSGGLDSLIGCLDFLSNSANDKAILISHYDPQMKGPKTDQDSLLTGIEQKYPNRIAHLPSIRVFLNNSTLPKETTFRSRSILFVGIAMLVGQPLNLPVIIPENGSVSLNFPLSPSRRSACSTRTTHPTFIELLRQLWNGLRLNQRANNPYENCTKGQMVNNCGDPVLLEQLIQTSNSCGKRGHRIHWDHPTATHCGVCMPCVYRQASLARVTDTTTYGNSINKPHLLNKQQGSDLSACLRLLRSNPSPDYIKQELIINGLRDVSRLGSYISVVERTIDELKAWVRAKGNLNVRNEAGV